MIYFWTDSYEKGEKKERKLLHSLHSLFRRFEKSKKALLFYIGHRKTDGHFGVTVEAAFDFNASAMVFDNFLCN